MLCSNISSLQSLLQEKQGCSLEQADTNFKTRIINLETAETTQNVQQSQMKIYIPEYTNDKETKARENLHDPTVKSKVKLTAKKVKLKIISIFSLNNNLKRN